MQHCVAVHLEDTNLLFMCFSTVAEVLALLEDEGNNDNSEVVDIFLEPPDDDGISDQDSDKSDGEVEFNVNHLGGNLLSAGCEVRRSNRIQQQQHVVLNDSSDEEDDQEEIAESIPDSPSPATCDGAISVKRRKSSKQPENITWTKRKTLPKPPGAQSYVGHSFSLMTN